MNEKSSCPVLRGRDGGNTILLPDHLAAVTTNTGRALIVTGRGIRSIKRQRSKQLGQLTKKQSRCKSTPGAGSNCSGRKTKSAGVPSGACAICGTKPPAR